MKFRKVKNIIQTVLTGIIMVAAILPFSPAGKSQANQPRFNFLQGDLELRRGANLTKGEVERHNPLTGDAGDSFEVAVYYHNGMPDTTAENTVVKVNMPDKTTDKTAAISVSVGADNADTVTNTIVNGQIVGQDALHLNLSDDSKLSYVPNSVKWYPNFTSATQPATALLNNQTGTELFSSNGLKVGDVNGCWQYVGYVVFQIKTEKISTPGQISKSKIAQNLNSGISGTDINANPGDMVKYTLTTKNTGGTAEGSATSDDLSDVLELSDIISTSEGGKISNNVLTFPSVSIAPGNTLSQTFTVKVKNPLPKTPQNGLHFDYIMQNLFGNFVYVRLPKPTPGEVSLHLDKAVRDFTAGEATFASSNQARPGDTLEYRLNFSNTGTVNADSVVLLDVLPLNTQYLAGSTVISSSGGSEHTIVDGISAAGINIGTIAAGDSGYVKFRVSTNLTLANGAVLLNTGYLKYQNSTLSGEARTTMVKSTTPVNPNNPELPKTGADTWLLTLVALAAAIVCGYYFKVRKLYLRKLN
ncbi:MAG: DUF11 domain-containing protein [Candidatus Berkelbacteria bacterium]|nr:DUF11 domain-containing protein [Candidatus Berkelbacteria bacterium]